MSASNQRILIAVATYNERETLPRLVQDVCRIVPDADLLIIDDNSPDGTGRWVDEQAVENSRIRVIHRPEKLGLGTATIEALRYCLEHQYDLLVTLDADGSHDPKSIPDLLRPLADRSHSGPDVVVGSRYVAGGRIEGWPWYRHWMSRAVNRAARILLGLPVRDCSGAYRCTRATIIARIDLEQIASRGYSFFEEVLWHFMRAGATFAEVPIVFVNRTQGQSKINGREALRSLGMLFRLGMVHWFGR